jgi:hypothetical protein
VWFGTVKLCFYFVKPVDTGRFNSNCMYNRKHLPWENYPKKLRHQEIVNPLVVLTDFFSVDFMDGHCRKLKRWRYYVTLDRAYKDKRHGSGSLLFTYDLNIKLLEAAYLLHYNTEKKRTAVDEKQMAAEREAFSDYPENLSLKELIDPYRVLRAIFSSLDLQQYRDHLHDWLYSALYKNGDEELSEKEISTVYKNIRKLYSAAFLIYQREIVNKDT